MTFSKSLYTENQLALLTTIINDSVRNGDGWALVGVDSLDGDNNIRFQSMKLDPIVDAMETFFKGCSKEGRVFLHSRFATTSSVGIAFNHAFDDRQGNIVMHNGVFRRGVSKLEVDSFKLADMNLGESIDVLDDLLDDGETFGNIFIIDTVNLKYSVVRLSVGSLYTDGQGNYSTNVCGPITQEVKRESEECFWLPLPPRKPKAIFEGVYSGKHNTVTAFDEFWSKKNEWTPEEDTYDEEEETVFRKSYLDERPVKELNFDEPNDTGYRQLRRDAFESWDTFSETAWEEYEKELASEAKELAEEEYEDALYVNNNKHG